MGLRSIGILIGLILLGIALIYVGQGLKGLVFFGFLVGIVVLYVATGMWLDAHGGARRWHLWVMSVIAFAAVGGGMFMAAQPPDPRFIGLGVGVGALFGVVYGLFAKVPRPRQRRQVSRKRQRS